MIIIITIIIIITTFAIFFIYIIFIKSLITLIAFINIVLILFVINTIFINLNINAKIIKIYARLNTMLNNIFNDNKNKHELLSIFKKIINNNNERINFRMREIE